MCLSIRLPAHVFFTIMKFHNNEIHNNERTPVLIHDTILGLGEVLYYKLGLILGIIILLPRIVIYKMIVEKCPIANRLCVLTVVNSMYYYRFYKV